MLAWCCCNKSPWIFHRVVAVLNAFQGENGNGDLFGPPWIWTDEMYLIRCALSNGGHNFSFYTEVSEKPPRKDVSHTVLTRQINSKIRLDSRQTFFFVELKAF
jgi:hypothetical protein